MNTAKDMLFTATTIALIVLAIVGIFYLTMDRPAGPNVHISVGER